MRRSGLVRITLSALLWAVGASVPLAAQIDSSSSITQAPSQPWMIPTRLGTLDATTGKASFALPLGPRLPGRIPGGFTLTFDGSLNRASFRPVTWRLGNGGQTATNAYSNTLSLFGQDFVFCTPDPSVVLPATATVQGWATDRHIDLNKAAADAAVAQAQASYSNIISGPTETWMIDRIQTTTDGTKFLVWCHWRIQWTTPGRTDNDVTHTQDLPMQGFVIAGDQGVAQNGNVTNVTTRWGDKVSITENTTTDGQDATFVIRNEVVTAQSITLTVHAVIPSCSDPSTCSTNFRSATLSVDHTLGTPKLPTASVAGYYRVPTAPPLWTGSTTWAGQFVPTASTRTASGGTSLTTQFQWKIPLTPGFYLTTNSDSPYDQNIYDTISEIDYPDGFRERLGINSGQTFSDPCWDKTTGQWRGWQTNTVDAEGGCSLDRIAPDGSGQSIRAYHDSPLGHFNTSNAWVWDTTTHRTYLYTFSQPFSGYPPPASSLPYRLARLTHVALPGSDFTSTLAFLAYTCATVQEEDIHGTAVDASGHPTDGVTDRVVQFSGWDLSSWANPHGYTGIPTTAVATRITEYRVGLPTRTTLAGDLSQNGRDSYGPVRTDTTTAAPSGTGLPTTLLTGSETIGWNTASTNPPLPLTGTTRRTGLITRTWNSTAAVLETLTDHKTLDGGSLPPLRMAWTNGSLTGVSLADFGITTTTYDATLGLPTQVQGARGAFTATETRTYVSGQPLVQSVRKSLSDGTSTVYTGSGAVGTDYVYDTTAFHWLIQETNQPDGRPITYTRDDLGRVTSGTDVLGVVTATTYDAWGRVASTTRQAHNGVAALTTAYAYDPAGMWKTETVTEGDTGRALTTRTDFDTFGRVAKVTAPDGSTQTFQYDGFGQKIAQSPVLKPGQTAWGNETWAYDGQGRVTDHWDSQSRLLMHVSLQPTWTTLNGITAVWTTAQDDRGYSRSEGTDLLGQKVAVVDQASQLSTYAYDKDGHLIQTQQGGQTRAYVYNDMGWLASRTEPEEGATLYSSFTMLGVPQVSTQKGRSGGRTNTFTTTLNSWLLPITVNASGPEGTVARTLTYDATTHLLTGLSETQVNGTLTETYGYDGLFRPTTKTVSDGTQTFSVSQGLDAAGRQLSLTYPSAAGRSDQTITGYDSLGRPITVTLNGETKPAGSMVYDQVSGTAVTNTLTFGNNAWTTSVTNKGELTHVTHTAAAGVLEDDAITWTAGGVMLARGADTFGYDALQRLNASHVRNLATSAFVDQAFTYDRYGNRASASTSAPAGTLSADSEALSWSATYTSGNDLPATVTATSGGLSTGVLYDDLGRMSQVWTTPGQSGTLTTWIYDPSGRVVKENGTTYLLDAAGLRFKRVAASGAITYTVYGFGREPLKVFIQAPAGSLAWQRSVVYGFGQELREDQVGSPMSTIYLQSDQVGSPNYATDGTGTLVNRTKNLPFGERMLDASAGAPKSIRRFTNHEDDPDSNAIYMQAREYLAAYGKFAQVDPAYDQIKLDPESWNLYNYTTNNPVTHTDPDGRIQKMYSPNLTASQMAMMGETGSCMDAEGSVWFADDDLTGSQAASTSAPQAPPPATEAKKPNAETAQANIGFDTTIDASFMPQLFDRLTPRDASQLSLSGEGRSAIEGDEGNQSEVYLDTATPPNPTAGVGHLLTPSENAKYPVGSTVPQKVRDNWFTADLNKAAGIVANLVKAPINQFQFDALTNFAFQMGSKHLESSNLLRDINNAILDQFGIRGLAPTNQQIYKDFHGWNLGGPGIPARRDREIDLYNNGIYP